MRFVKPIDEQLVTQLALKHKLIVTVEENAVMGGAGSAVNEYLLATGIQTNILNLGTPDQFIHQDKPSNMLSACGLDTAGITSAIAARLASGEDSNITAMNHSS